MVQHNLFYYTYRIYKKQEPPSRAKKQIRATGATALVRLCLAVDLAKQESAEHDC